MRKILIITFMEIILCICVVYYLKNQPLNTHVMGQNHVISVEIYGAVKQPGSYVINADTNVSSLIKFAGGLLPNADVKQVKLYDKLTQQRYEIPFFKEDTTEKYIEKVNLNHANIEELKQIPGMKGDKLEQFIAYRIQVGTLFSIEELLKVKGIGDTTFLKMKAYVTV